MCRSSIWRPPGRATPRPPRACGRIAEVCGRVGFFYVKNHGLSDADIAAIFQTSADFHNLPLDAKMEVSMTKNNHAQGYLHGMTKGNEKGLSENLQEAFQIKRPLADDDPDLLAGKPLHGKIPWPSAMPDLKPRMMAYYDKVDVLGYEMLTLFELALGAARGRAQAVFQEGHEFAAAPALSAAEAGRGRRASRRARPYRHQCVHDPGAGRNGGLEIRNRDNEWVAVPPIDGHAGRQCGRGAQGLERWRLLVDPAPGDQPLGPRRYSIPFFMYPSYDALIQPLLKNPDPANVAPENLHTSMPRDKPFVYGEFKSRHTAKIMPGSEGGVSRASRAAERAYGAYVIGEADIVNRDAMKDYGPMVVAAVKKYGGK